MGRGGGRRRARAGPAAPLAARGLRIVRESRPASRPHRVALRALAAATATDYG